jgi:hypothetical protein
MFGIDNYDSGALAENFQRHINASTAALARDLASLLNRAKDHGFAICPDVDDDGVSYSIEWCFGGQSHALDVEYDAVEGEWQILVGDIEAQNTEAAR